MHPPLFRTHLNDVEPPHIALPKNLESGRGDADDGARSSIKRDAASNQAAVATESRFPEILAEDHGVGLLLLVSLVEETSGDGRDSEESKEMQGDGLSKDTF